MENYSKLYEVIHSLKQEQEELQKQIDDNLFKMKEAEYYIESLFEKEEKDFKVFSPRDIETKHKDDIEKIKRQKSEYINNNELLITKQNEVILNIKKLEFFLQEKIDRYTDLSVINIQEEDRQRIARDLHDTSLQNLTHLIHKLELAGLYIEQDPIKAKLELAVIKQSLKNIIAEIRNTIFDLRPMTFDDLGLKAAFERLLLVINENNKYELDVMIDDVSCEIPLVLVTIYRVVQECFNNINKYSQATKVKFNCFQKENKLVIDIEDNGIGFSLEEIESRKNMHFGISVMKERVDILGGNISIDSKIKIGTRVHIEVPLN